MKRKNGMANVRFLIGLLLLSGCAGSAVEQAKTPWETLKQEARQCFSDIGKDAELRSIANKVTLGSTYDRDVYFELASIRDLPTADERIAIGKWAARLKPCYKLKVESYAYEPASIAKWSAAMDGEQQALVSEFSRGGLSYGRFAARRLEIDTKYRSEITRAVAADYKRPENMQQNKDGVSPKSPADAASSCGWEGKQWVCRSL